MKDKTNTKYIYFVRHGQSTSNAEGLRQGGDSVLTEKGIKQAQFLGRRLSTLPIDVLLASTYVRAKQTAEEIGKITGHEIIFSDLLVERRNPSRSVGKSFEDPEWEPVFKDIHKNYGDPNWRFEDAENGADLLSRAEKALQFIIDRPEQHIVVVTHGMFLRFMLAHIIGGAEIYGKDLPSLLLSFATHNTGVSIIEYSTDHSWPWRIDTWNDQNHLADLVD